MTDYQDPGRYWQQRLARSFDLTGAGFDSLGPEYNRQLYRVRIDSLAALLREMSVDIRRSDVLEIGCGTGFYTDWMFAQGVQSYTGVDITAVSVQRLQDRHPRGRFIQADVTSTALPLSQQFDVVLIADVLFHVVDDRRFAAALDNIARSLRPGGVLILSDILSVSTVQYVAHCRWRSYEDYKEALSAVGLRTVQLRPIFVALHPPMNIAPAPLRWRLYHTLWQRVLFRLARYPWFDYAGSRALAQLDRAYLLPRATAATPNSKWLVAVRDAAPDA